MAALLGLLASAAVLAAQPNSILTIDTVAIPAGPFLQGSTRAEREAAYQLNEAAYGHSITRQNRWYESEPDLQSVETAGFEIMRTPVTNAMYAAFIASSGHPAPDVDRPTWRGYRLIHPYERTRPFAWVNGKVPEGRERHPVVLVSRQDALAFAEWLSAETGKNWRLPDESEWEKAARGTGGHTFPWSARFDPSRLNSHDQGPFSTVQVGSFATGASPYGMLDAAGQVFEWTATQSGAGRSIVKGGSWDDKGCGVCRPPARHPRPDGIRHILIGFRLVAGNPH